MIEIKVMAKTRNECFQFFATKTGLSTAACSNLPKTLPKAGLKACLNLVHIISTGQGKNQVIKRSQKVNECKYRMNTM